jgi:succinoglycan biosynthesis transport protein ExoP
VISSSQAPPPDTEELNLGQLLAALQRRWPLILAGAAIGGLAATWLTSRIKPVWEGSFQIVLASRDSGGSSAGSLLGANPLLASLAGLGRGGDASAERETQVKILESPSVLRPVFEQVRSRKAALGDNVAGYDFADWAANLKVALNKGTSVLEITYRDNQKSLILPVLREVSDTYQAYSSQERTESLRNGLAFAQQQLNRFRSQAEQSNRALDSFRIRYGIAATGNTVSGGSVDVGKLLNQSATDVQGSAIQIQGGSSGSAPSSKGDPLGQLAAINQELIRARQTFTDNDPSIQALIRERDALQRYIESTAIGTLALPGQQPLSKEEAQSIVLRYQELDRIANRNNATLDSLESAVLSLQLEQARATKPWQLISTPSLQDRPVAPRPARNLAIGLASGLLVGCAAALVADRRSGRVFNPQDINDALGFEPLAVLHGSDPEAWTTTLQLLANGPLTQTHSLALVPIGLSLDAPSLASLQQALQMLLPNTALNACSNLVEASHHDNQLLITTPGAASRSQLTQLRQQLDLLPHPIGGWLLVGAP